MSRPSKDQLAQALAGMAGGSEPAEAVPADPASPGGSDDAVIAPPPDRAVLGRTRSPASKPRDVALQSRRTLIPVLLTLGILLPAVGSLKWLSGPDSPYAAWPTWAAAALLMLGPLLLVLAVANMLQVKRMLSSQRARRHAV